MEAAQISENTIAADRRLLPRSQVGRVQPVHDAEGNVVGTYTNLIPPRPARQYYVTFRFELGQPVMWLGSPDEVWIVQSRTLSAAGRRYYTVTREGDERPVRTVLENMLAPL